MSSEKNLDELGFHETKIDCTNHDLPLHAPVVHNEFERIALRNRNKIIVDYTFIDEDLYHNISLYKWHKTIKGYVKGTVNKRTVFLHRFIMGLLNVADKLKIVDHIDNNPLNNKSSNLRIVTSAQNAQNKMKLANRSSKYTGVSFDAERGVWRAKISKHYLGDYENEDHAAHAYNIEAKKQYGDKARLNNVELNKVSDFVPWTRKRKHRNIETGVYKHGNKYQARIAEGVNTHYLGSFETKEEALEARKQAEVTKKQKTLDSELHTNQDKSKIVLSNTNPVQYTIIDEDDYDWLIERKWCIINGYACDTSKKQKMHRLIMKCTDHSILVDHINGNKLDNRKSNLRIVSESVNSHNRPKIITTLTTSKFIGVSKASSKNKYYARVSMNNKQYFAGSYPDQVVAAYARDCLAKELYGNDAKLNNVECPDGWVYLNQKCVQVQSTKN